MKRRSSASRFLFTNYLMDPGSSTIPRTGFPTACILLVASSSPRNPRNERASYGTIATVRRGLKGKKSQALRSRSTAMYLLEFASRPSSHSRFASLEGTYPGKHSRNDGPGLRVTLSRYPVLPAERARECSRNGTRGLEKANEKEEAARGGETKTRDASSLLAG